MLELALTKNIDVLAPYYLWYKEESWLSISKTAYTTPLRGNYDSADLDVIIAQNVEKKRYGVGVDLVSWWGPHEGFEEVYLPRAEVDERFCGLLYELTGRMPVMDDGAFFDFSNNENKKQFLDDIEYMEEHYFNLPIYYKINGKPILYLWMETVRNLDIVVDEIKDRVFLIGSVRMDEPPSINDTETFKLLENCDAFSQYGIGPVRLAGEFGFISDEFIERFKTGVREWARIIQKINHDRGLNKELILPIQFAYHDNRGDIDPNNGKSRVLNHDPIQSEKFIKCVRELADELDLVKRVILVSYNEHWEGHGAEPSVQYGNFWLSLIKKYFKDYVPPPVIILPEIKPDAIIPMIEMILNLYHLNWNSRAMPPITFFRKKPDKEIPEEPNVVLYP